MFQDYNNYESSVCLPRFRNHSITASSDCSTISMDSYCDSLESFSQNDPKQDDFIYQVQFKFTYRFCSNASGIERLQIGQFVILEGRNGQIDLGVISRLFTPDQFALTDEINKDKITIGCISRCATDEERSHLPFKHSQEVKLLQISKFLVEKLQLPMKVYGIDYQFDGQRVTVYYTADGPVAKELFVGELFKCCHTNISMVQTSRRTKFSLQPFAIRALTTGSY